MNSFKRPKKITDIFTQFSNMSFQYEQPTIEDLDNDMDEIEPLIKTKPFMKRLQYKPCSIIMGKTGAGKTTLVNKICGTEHECGAGIGSMTRQLYLNTASCGDYPFSLIDTPGTNAKTEVYKHAYLLREALTTQPINTIFIVIRYDNRFDTILEDYELLEQLVYNYDTKIVVMISHWDLSKAPEKDFAQICQVFKDYCSNIICYSEKSSKRKIANLMYGCMSNMKAESLEINDEDFFLRYNVVEIKRNIKKSLDEYSKMTAKRFREFSDAVMRASSTSTEEKDEILHMLIVEFKNEMDKLLVSFRDKHKNEMNELNYYTFYIQMEKENVQLCDSFVKKVTPLMSYNLFDAGDPRNLIKRCPNPECELIWFKTEGCDGATTCGNNCFESCFDRSSKPFWKYALEWVDGKLQWRKLHHSDMLSIPRIFIKQAFSMPRSSTNKSANSKKVGCGQQIVWSELPKVEDELILELFKVKTIDEAVRMIKSGEFQNVRRDYESSIDTSLHS